MRYLTVVCLTLVVAFGCAHRNQSTETPLETWKGTHRSALAEKLGEPGSTLSDGKGGEILLYKYDHTTRVYGPDPTMHMGTRKGNSQERIAGHVVVRGFYVDAKGLVYDIKEKKERRGLVKWDSANRW